MQPPAVYLMGPTGAGKTDMAMKLAAAFPFEVINVDSAQIYKGMDIGTAKPSKACLQQVPHHLIDIREPHQAYSAADFRRDALNKMAVITAAGKIPLLVGGTMFYFRTLEYGIDILPGADGPLRDRLARRAKQVGWPALHRQLARVDPKSAQRIDPHDRQRIQRALEVNQLTGSPVGGAGAAVPPAPYRIHKLAVTPADRAALHRRIDHRFRDMLARGMVDEVRQLLQREEISLDLQALRVVGYRQVGEYLVGKVSYNEMLEKAVAGTRQLAKRQLTWLRNQRGVVWINSLDVNCSDGPANSVLNYLIGKLSYWAYGGVPIEICRGEPHYLNKVLS
jgi:tRNA dimethylallyltransferase